MNIKNPIVLKRTDGEVAIGKKYGKKEEYLYKSFMTICATDDKSLVDTKDMDDKDTMSACAMQYDKMRPVMNEVSESGLTEKQKKLPPALQKAILKKMKQGGKSEEEEKKVKPVPKGSHRMPDGSIMKDSDMKKKDKEEDKSDAKHGLWHNIKMKKERMGKNYRPAKPGDKDRPSKKALEKAQKSSKSKASEEAISELKEIAEQLDGASALHKGQAKRIRAMIKREEAK